MTAFLPPVIQLSVPIANREDSGNLLAPPLRSANFEKKAFKIAYVALSFFASSLCQDMHASNAFSFSGFGIGIALGVAVNTIAC